MEDPGLGFTHDASSRNVYMKAAMEPVWGLLLPSPFLWRRSIAHQLSTEVEFFNTLPANRDKR